MKTKALEKKKTRKVKLEKLEGYLFAKLHAIGSKSEGPLYYLQLWNGKEVIVVKKVRPWENDPVLHGWLGKKVVIYGRPYSVEMGETIRPAIAYEWLMNDDEPLAMKFKLDLKDNTLWINNMPGPAPEFPPEMKKLNMTLAVRWPYRTGMPKKRSHWKGECPTSQCYDFWLEDPKGNVIWQWGQCMLFKNEPTEVVIPGGSAKKVRASWPYFEDAIGREGLYVARARFIASGQEIRMPFEVKFAV